MSDQQEGSNWWLADDNRWYPPERWTGPPGTLPPSQTAEISAEPLQLVPEASASQTADSRIDGELGPNTTDSGFTVMAAQPWYRTWPALAAAAGIIFLSGLLIGSVIGGSDSSETAAVGTAASARLGTTTAPLRTTTTTTPPPTTTIIETTTALAAPPTPAAVPTSTAPPAPPVAPLTTTPPAPETVPVTAPPPPPNFDLLMCAELKPVMDDWWGNISVGREVSAGITRLRDNYRGLLSPGFQAAMDAAKSALSDPNVRLFEVDTDVNRLSQACNNTFGTGIATGF
jgi:hypothetical protein